MALRVVVIDDHLLFARGLELLLGSASAGDIEVVAICANADEARRTVDRYRPDAALVDLALPDVQGTSLIRELRTRFPALVIVVLSGTESLDEASRALAAGADAFLPKTSEPDELLAPLHAVAKGWSVLPRQLVRHLTGHIDAAPSQAVADLSSDERSLLRFVATGADTSQIAAELIVSERTAKRLVAGLLQKLGVSNRVQAAAIAGRAGLADAPAPPRR